MTFVYIQVRCLSFVNSIVSLDFYYYIHLTGESISKGDGHSRVYREQWNENEPRYPPRNTV